MLRHLKTHPEVYSLLEKLSAMLVEAAKEEHMPLGFYYSPPDMHHPGFRDTSKPASENWKGEPTRPEWPLYLDYMELQVRELLTRYGNVLVLWFDGLADQQNGSVQDLQHHRKVEKEPSGQVTLRLAGQAADNEGPGKRRKNLQGLPLPSLLFLGGLAPS